MPASANDWQDRLEQLSPTDPLAYFLLAEEISDTGEQSELAKRLFGLSAILAPDRYARSAAIAMAEIETDDRRRQRLLALAAVLTTDASSRLPHDELSTRAMLQDDDSAVQLLGEAFSFFRRGTGNRALNQLERADALHLLRLVDHALPGGAHGFQELARAGRGTGRPRISDGHHLNLMQLEYALLAGDERTWSSDLVLHRGEPLIEIDPQQLEDVLEVDASRPRFRSGQWVR